MRNLFLALLLLTGALFGADVTPPNINSPVPPNYILAGPASGSNAIPAWRASVSADIAAIDASKITTGTIATARLGSGTANGSTFLSGDQTYKAVPTSSTTLDVNGNFYSANTSITNLTTGSYNTFLGLLTGSTVTSGQNNTAIGFGSLGAVTTGQGNTALGFGLGSTTTGSFNTSVGGNGLPSNTTGDRNIAMGLALGTNTTGTYNIGIGNNADVSGTGQTNSIAIGKNAIAGASNVMSLGGTSGDAVSIIVGGTTPDASAILDLTSTTKGFLPPRMTTTQKNAISSPAAGSIVYDATLNSLYYYNGSAWGTIGGTTTNASLLTSGTLADARLSANVPLLNAANSFSQSIGFTSFLGEKISYYPGANYGVAIQPNTIQHYTSAGSDRFQLGYGGAGSFVPVLTSYNGNIGIGQTTPLVKLDVTGNIHTTVGILSGTPATPDSSADSLFATSNQYQKGLVIQGQSGQGVDLFEVQNYFGNVIAGFNSTGQLTFGDSTAPSTPMSGGIFYSDTGHPSCIGTAGIAAPLASHPEDGPPALYDNVGLDVIRKSVSYYTGTIEWINETRMVRKLDGEAVAGKCRVVETFADYNARMKPVDPLIVRVWETDQAKMVTDTTDKITAQIKRKSDNADAIIAQAKRKSDTQTAITLWQSKKAAAAVNKTAFNDPQPAFTEKPILLFKEPQIKPYTPKPKPAFIK